MSAFILTAGEMRAAEQAVIARGTSADALMERAGQAVARAVLRFAGAAETLVLCGPGNNGGDGYVIARVLREAGVAVRVAAVAPPATAPARKARDLWGAEGYMRGELKTPVILIDALFGTGLKRGLEPVAHEQFMFLSKGAQVRIAVDLPTGASSDDGAILSPVPNFDLTVALGAYKPAHWLQPAAATMGRIVVADIGVPVSSGLVTLEQPRLTSPGVADHKYTRGLVGVVAGEMPGAARLAALGAARSGAGYVRVLGSDPGGLPASIVCRAVDDEALGDIRVGALVVGPGLGRGADAAALLARVVAAGRPLVLDADALWHLGTDAPAAPAILTPHEGEFVRMFGALDGSKVERARTAAARCGAVVVLKGADTVVAAPDGRAAIAGAGSFDLATAGTGDVLAGVCGTMLAQLRDPFAAACAAVWLHGAASRALAGPFIADDLAAALPAQVARCR